MSKTTHIQVTGSDITVLDQHGTDYISLTDMTKAKDDDSRAADIIKNWLRNRGTIEFLGVWEQVYNQNFKVVEFDHFRKQAGLPTFTLSVNTWVEKTGAIGIFSRSGKNGGTYAHKDIAFEFGSAISPLFKLYLIREYQRLKDDESKLKNLEWDYRRFLSKVNYRVHTDAIKESIIPTYPYLTKEQERYIYANEAELLNMAIFGKTSKQWRSENVKDALEGKNIRDMATIPQLTVLSNMENLNSIMIKDGVAAERRFKRLQKEATSQLKSLANYNYSFPIESPHATNNMNHSGFDQALKGLMAVRPPKKVE